MSLGGGEDDPRDGDDRPREGDGEREAPPDGVGSPDGSRPPDDAGDGAGGDGREPRDGELGGGGPAADGHEDEAREGENEDEDEDEEHGGGVWRFALDEVDEEGIVRPSIEPGDPDPENVLFVVLGAIAMVLIFVRLWMLV